VYAGSFHVFVVCRVGSGHCDMLITRAEDSYPVCVCVCVCVCLIVCNEKPDRGGLGPIFAAGTQIKNSRNGMRGGGMNF